MSEINWLINVTNAERYIREYGGTLQSVTRKHVHFTHDGADYYMEHAQVRSALHAEAPLGATHRGEKWHYYKCDGMTWRVWKEGRGWCLVEYKPKFLIDLATGERIDF